MILTIVMVGMALFFLVAVAVVLCLAVWELVAMAIERWRLV